MNRLIVLKTLVKQKKLKNYLEIGVHTGYIFFRVKGRNKIAVDPKFELGKFRVYGKIFNFPYNLNNRLFEITSDDFFENHAAREFKNFSPELIFIDGMHEYQYAYRDVVNSLKYLSPNGVIVVHDCNPKTRSAASTYQEYVDNKAAGFWNGNVWKAIVDLRSNHKDLNVFVLDCDHGLGIITRGKPQDVLNYSTEEITAMTYDDFESDRVKMLNLKDPSYFYSFFNLKDERNTGIRRFLKQIYARITGRSNAVKTSGI